MAAEPCDSVVVGSVVVDAWLHILSAARRLLSTEVWQGTRFSTNCVDHQLLPSWTSSSAMIFAETGIYFGQT